MGIGVELWVKTKAESEQEQRWFQLENQRNKMLFKLYYFNAPS